MDFEDINIPYKPDQPNKSIIDIRKEDIKINTNNSMCARCRNKYKCVCPRCNDCGRSVYVCEC